ncbi:juvenile hormone esterase-like [Penaeus indicus]|uniref:juvenile hormone esterase-like n=1 Tax=Penaeus indicus TaxID=29960 RepID=UPI00300D0220
MQGDRFSVLGVVLAAAVLVSGARTPLRQQAEILTEALEDRVLPGTAEDKGRVPLANQEVQATEPTSQESSDPTISSSTVPATSSPAPSTSPPAPSSSPPAPSTSPPASSTSPPAPSSSPPAPATSPPTESSPAPSPSPPSAAPTPSPTPAPSTFPEVTVEGLGTARGKVMTSYLGRPFYAFMSLPYAEPPIDELRFKNPKPWTGPWIATLDGSYDATYLRARCPQISLILDVTAGREDCLHLSIYTPMMPDSRDTTQLPVMVWIHGGAYMTGDANLYVPTKLMDRDVIVVVVQYRLGSFGFLAGGIAEAPGNMGLMDQIMALRWVQDHITAFGGDRDSVTVFGQSAGGASTSWMQITPLTNETVPENNNRQLVHKVLPMSGSSFEEWTLDPDPDSGFWLTAEILNCDQVKDKVKAVECMRGRSMDEVNRASLKIYSDDRQAGGLGFKGLCPVVQDTLAAENLPDLELVIPKSPVKIVEANEFLQVPVMTGSVRDEGSLVVGLAYKDYLFPNEHYPNDTEFARDDMVTTLIQAFGIEDRTGSVTNAMTLSFLPNAEMGNWYSMVGGLVDMGGMLFLKSGLWQLAHSINKVSPNLPVFFYSWEFESDDSLFPWIFISMPDIPVPGGIGHADELLYLFHLPNVLDERQKLMSERMLTLWTNFAKYGNPTPLEFEYEHENWTSFAPEWKLFSREEPNFMLIQDDLTNELDFSTRWNYHIDAGITTTPGPSSSEDPDPVSREDYDKQVEITQQFQIATGVLGGLSVCTLFLAAVFFVRMRRMKTV